MKRYHRDLPVSKLVMEYHHPLSAFRVAEHIARLRESEANGEPLYSAAMTVRKNRNGTYSILDGQHRFIAYLMCGWEKASCLVQDSVRK